MAAAVMGSVQSVDVGLAVELWRRRAEEPGEEEEVVGVSGEMAEIVSEGRNVVLVAGVIKVPELAESTAADSKLASVTELVVVDICDVLVEGEEATMMTETTSPTAAGEASTGRISLDSGKDNLVERFIEFVETGLSSWAAGTVSDVLMEGIVIVVEPEVT